MNRLLQQKKKKKRLCHLFHFLYHWIKKSNHFLPSIRVKTLYVIPTTPFPLLNHRCTELEVYRFLHHLNNAYQILLTNEHFANKTLSPYVYPHTKYNFLAHPFERPLASPSSINLVGKESNNYFNYYLWWGMASRNWAKSSLPPHQRRREEVPTKMNVDWFYQTKRPTPPASCKTLPPKQRMAASIYSATTTYHLPHSPKSETNPFLCSNN